MVTYSPMLLPTEIQMWRMRREPGWGAVLCSQSGGSSSRATMCRSKARGRVEPRGMGNDLQGSGGEVWGLGRLDASPGSAMFGETSRSHMWPSGPSGCWDQSSPQPVCWLSGWALLSWLPCWWGGREGDELQNLPPAITLGSRGGGKWLSWSHCRSRELWATDSS